MPVRGKSEGQSHRAHEGPKAVAGHGACPFRDMDHRQASGPCSGLVAVIASLALLGCSGQGPPTSTSQTPSAAEKTNRTGADGSGDGPTALSPAEKARAAAASGSLRC